jgi:hypothetical protein
MTDEQPQTVTREHYDYGRLWPDGTFNKLGWNEEKIARREFDEKSYELKNVPVSLRPIFGQRRVVTTIETYPAEARPEAAA